MNLSHCYAELLTAADGMLRETPESEVTDVKNELELQAHWFAGDFGSSFLTATTGERVEIVQFGVWNRAAGPDFSGAAVRFDDRPGTPVVRGSIELDMHADGWEQHGHGSNPDFDDVVLHLYLQRGAKQSFTRTSQHRQVAQVQLDLRQIDGRPSPLAGLPLAKAGRCQGPLAAMAPGRIDAVLTAAAQYRLEAKNRRWQRLAAVRGYDEALFQSLAATLGYRENKLPFALLAQRLTLKRIRAAGAGSTALLLGLSGFLEGSAGEGPAEAEPETRAYLRTCWEHWWPRRDELERLILPAASWKLGGQRPANHPQRRLAALAQLARRWPEVRGLIERGGENITREVLQFLETLHDPYWSHHYTLTSARAARPVALVGATRATEMLANVFFPLSVAAHPGLWPEYEKLQAAMTNRRVETAATRLFGDRPDPSADDDGSPEDMASTPQPPPPGAGAEGKVADEGHMRADPTAPPALPSRRQRWLKRAAHQQGLLQIYEDFCLPDDSDCERCTFPERVRCFHTL